ncbi:MULTISPECIES: carbohydrate ABC transporter permease [Paenibacillus]|jgi:ABC-type glycerol-3-phosphate transport system permease component|uniref:ABC transporter permease n=1 Tax=Paenibacillus odorifer TaxID=189426 RepID=A0A1R0YUF4_9BACL|nr:MULTISPECIES: carbohydrate ABC transporter permease [Paenibacillus]AWV35557.1 carbohydrate ABC transporter permease [Paenibacillus odorifer]ETT63945.1 binding-protein-dependent transport system inner membrane protein [Paenibacillus sp. FSL H8-237]MDH6430849.1 ABC-type glycerol-3-phosphate transport system permease component [Paenibacillus sp. PastH-4]MDH6446715.1 ABC-type glycerol-3-phosphate transport system permease component [Paenibacillus sp. PastF-4]MDH6531201.1 ABC-type glycerol-3-pho
MHKINLRRIDYGGIFLYLFLTVFGLIMLLPLVYMAVTALKPTSELFLFPPRFFVVNPTLVNFRDLLLITGTSAVPFSRFIFNSVVVTSGIVVGGVLISAMAAYPLAKHNMPFKSAIFSMIVAALMFSPLVLQIPQYLLISRSGLMNSYFAMILPYLAAPMGMFLMTQFLRQLPDALLEAARIDGASEWKVFWVVVMPMLKPAISTFALFSFISAWNDPYPSMVYTTVQEMKTLPLAIQTISGGAGVVARVGTLAAASFLMILPTILVFILTQRMVLQTMAHSGLKE